MKVFNIKTHGKIEGATYIGRGSPLGNPYIIGVHGNRKEVIAKYAIYLKKKILQRDNNIIEALRKIKSDASLLCFCSPLECHGEVIIQFLTEINKDGDFDSGITEFIKNESSISIMPFGRWKDTY